MLWEENDALLNSYTPLIRSFQITAFIKHFFLNIGSQPDISIFSKNFKHENQSPLKSFSNKIFERDFFKTTSTRRDLLISGVYSLKPRIWRGYIPIRSIQNNIFQFRWYGGKSSKLHHVWKKLLYIARFFQCRLAKMYISLSDLRSYGKPLNSVHFFIRVRSHT